MWNKIATGLVKAAIWACGNHELVEAIVKGLKK